MKHFFTRKDVISRLAAASLTVMMVFGLPAAVLADEASSSASAEEATQSTESSSEESTGSTESSPEETQTQTEETESEEVDCTGSTGCGQGEEQGSDQGTQQGGPSLEDLGGTVNENGETVLPEGVEDTRQGSSQGTGYNGGEVSGENSNTGAGSNNEVTGDVSNTNSNTTNNTANDSSNVTASGNTGGNTNSENTNTGKTTTGNAGVGVTQVKQDNTTVQGGEAGLNVSAHKGDYDGDLEIDFANAIALLAGDGSGKSVRAVNESTGQDSENDIVFSFEDISDTEVQNDGRIDNVVNAEAITGQNEASKNTSDGVIKTGDANVAATLVNLLNTTVLNGNLFVSVKDIFGNLNGDITIPDLSQLASILSGGGKVAVEAENEQTGSDSENTIDVDVTQEDTLAVTNEAEIDTKVKAEAITGQNEAIANTGGGHIDTGDASVSASNISVANTTVEGGNWGLVVVNALNKWLGFLVGDSGEVRQLSQDETIREIEARNAATGQDSENNIEISDHTENTTTVDNTAVIQNDVTASAITGQNAANKNTGTGRIATGDANVTATAVNVANTTVKNANLGIAVVNVFGDWAGDLMYAGKSLLGFAGGAPTEVEIDAVNGSTGGDSTNTIDVNIERERTTDIQNNADVTTMLDTLIDTGNNKANRNTNGGDIETGRASLALHARTIANVTGIAGANGFVLDIEGVNEGTGVDSTNHIRARVNDEQVIAISNDANVSTILPGMVNTGHNQANQNTVGGDIDTGDIDADVAVENMLNRVMLALGGDIDYGSQALEIDGELINELTGSYSENINDVEATRSWLATVFNDAIVNTLIDLLFNTGHNESNGNTSAGHKKKADAPALETKDKISVIPVSETTADSGDDNESLPAHDSQEGVDAHKEDDVLAAAGGGIIQDSFMVSSHSEDDEGEVSSVGATGGESPEEQALDSAAPRIAKLVDENRRSRRAVPVTEKHTHEAKSAAAPLAEETFAAAVEQLGDSDAAEESDNAPQLPTILILGTIIGSLTGGAIVRRTFGR